MGSAGHSNSRSFLVASLVALSLFWGDGVHAQERTPLPDYVIEEFGTPPAVPDGPLSESLRSAITVAFIESMESTRWLEAQNNALAEIADAGDPRVAWLIADLMRFAPSRHLTVELAVAASRLLGIAPPPNNHWGVVTDHLIA